MVRFRAQTNRPHLRASQGMDLVDDMRGLLVLLALEWAVVPFVLAVARPGDARRLARVLYHLCLDGPAPHRPSAIVFLAG